MHFLQNNQAIRSLLEISLIECAGNYNRPSSLLEILFFLPGVIVGTIAVASISRPSKSLSFHVVKIVHDFGSDFVTTRILWPGLQRVYRLSGTQRTKRAGA